MGPIDKVHGSIDYRYTVICCGAAAICLNCTRSCSGVVCPAASASLSAQDAGYTADTSNAVHQYVAPPTATQSAPPTAHCLQPQAAAWLSWVYNQQLSELSAKSLMFALFELDAL